MAGLEALLFDLGGTLTTRDVEDRRVDELAVASLVRYLASKGCKLSKEDLLGQYWDHYEAINELRERFMIEIPMNVWLGSLTYKLCGREVADRVLAIAERTIVNARVNSAVPLTETVPVLEGLQSKFRLGIVTNTSSEKVTNGVLRRLGLNRFFECVVTSAEIGLRKPYPGIFSYALREMFLDPAKTVFIGDSLKHDIIGSKTVNMKNCLISDEAIKIPNGVSQPDLILRSLSQLPEALRRFDE